MLITITRRTGALAAVALAALSLSGCALQAKSQMAHRLTGAYHLAVQHGSADGQLQLRVKIISLSVNQTGAATNPDGSPKKYPEQTSPPLPMKLDLAADRALLMAVPTAAKGAPANGPAAAAAPAPAQAQPPKQPAAPQPFALYDHYAVYRYAPPVNAPAAAATAGAPAAADPNSDAGDDSGDVPRVWNELDFTTIKSSDHGRLQTLNPFPVLSPTLTVRLLNGALTGSVTRVGTETIDGVATTHYRFNVDRDKATRGLSDKQRQTIQQILFADNLRGTVMKGVEAWLDDQGLPRRLVVPFKQQLTKSDVMQLGYIMNLQYGPPAPIDVPSTDAVSEVGDIARLLSGPQA